MQKTARRASASSEALTAMDSSIGSSGGITLVMIIVQFSSSLKRSRSGFCAAPCKACYDCHSVSCCTIQHRLEAAAVKVKRAPESWGRHTWTGSARS